MKKDNILDFLKKYLIDDQLQLDTYKMQQYLSPFSWQKFEVELTGHQPALDRVLATGDSLIKSRHFASDQMKEKQDEVKEAWQSLLEHSAQRRERLNISLHKQKVFVFFFFFFFYFKFMNAF